VLELLRDHFATWLDKQVEAGALPDDPALVDGLKAASDKWRHPWELSSFHVPGLEVEVSIGDQPVRCQLGKAFLVSEDSVNWDGVFHVNQLDSTQAKLGQAYRQRAYDKAQGREQQQRAALLKDLSGDDDVAQRSALERVGAEGDAPWRPLLVKLQRERPALANAVDQALAGIDGAHQLDHQRAIIADPGFPPMERLGAAQRLYELAEAPEPGMRCDRCSRAPTWSTAWSASRR